MRFAQISYDSPEYRMECELRQSVLRAPLGLNLYDEDLSAERHQQHFGLFLADETLAACVIATAISTQEVKIRQMAVRSDLQGNGLGKFLMTQLQQTLEARETLIKGCVAVFHS